VIGQFLTAYDLLSNITFIVNELRAHGKAKKLKAVKRKKQSQ